MRMPVLFVGHGSPMNAIEDNTYTRGWREIAQKIPTPKAILSVSAHWYTRDSRINNESSPKTIHDMYGFPKELYEIIYGAPGSPEFASAAKRLISKESIFDSSWGIDHGTWSVLVHMYPKMEIPVFQISIDASAAPEAHYKIGQELKSLRDQGVLIFGTGNVVHNLRIVDFSMEDGYDWAYEFDRAIKESILSHQYQVAIEYKSFGQMATLAVPTPDHYYPLLYVLGASDQNDTISVYNESCVMGSLSMTSYLFESK